MPICSICGKKITTKDKFCPWCGAPTTFGRKIVFAGEVHKCPVCGEILPSMATVCPACGFEVNSAKVPSSVSKFVDQINEVDRLIAIAQPTPKPVTGWKTWGDFRRFLWVIGNILTYGAPIIISYICKKFFIKNDTPTLSPLEQRKASLIENFVFPNDKESVLEALLFTQSKIEFLSSEKIDQKNIFWIRLWSTKAEQIKQKADIILENDTISDKTCQEIQSENKTIKKKIWLKAGAGLALILLSLIVTFGLVFWPIIASNSLESSAYNSAHNSTYEEFEWEETGLSTKLPHMPFEYGKIKTNDDIELKIELYDISTIQFEDYINLCVDTGFDEDSEKYGKCYRAYNDEKYLLELRINDQKKMKINLFAPELENLNFKWSDLPLATVIPSVRINHGYLVENSKDVLSVIICDVFENDASSYVAKCEQLGFNIDVKKPENLTFDVYNEEIFQGYNKKGYWLSISYNALHEMRLTVKAPMKLSYIDWPETEIAKKLPRLTLDKRGKILKNEESNFLLYVGKMSQCDYDEYVNQCIEKGFKVESRGSNEFCGINGEFKLHISYQGYAIYCIDIYKI